MLVVWSVELLQMVEEETGEASRWGRMRRTNVGRCRVGCVRKQTEDKRKMSNGNRQRIGNLRAGVTHIRFAIPVADDALAVKTCTPRFIVWQVQRSRSPARAFHRIMGNEWTGIRRNERTDSQGLFCLSDSWSRPICQSVVVDYCSWHRPCS